MSQTTLLILSQPITALPVLLFRPAYCYHPTQVRGWTYRYSQIHASRHYELSSLHPAERAIFADDEFRRVLAEPAGHTRKFRYERSTDRMRGAFRLPSPAPFEAVNNGGGPGISSGKTSAEHWVASVERVSNFWTVPASMFCLATKSHRFTDTKRAI